MDPFIHKQKVLNRYFQDHPITENPVLCKICRRLCCTAREVTYDLHHGTRIFEAWCSDECFRADPDEKEKS